MAMYVYNQVWSNKINRTLIMSVLLTIWALIIEFYFLYWPKELIEKNMVLGILYTNIFGTTLLLDIFHIIVWSIAFFFSWMTYTLIKEVSRSSSAGIMEYVIFVLVYAFFILFINNLTVATVFVIVTALEFLYMFISLRDT